jgi:hypothetical protein
LLELARRPGLAWPELGGPELGLLGALAAESEGLEAVVLVWPELRGPELGLLGTLAAVSEGLEAVAGTWR